MKEPLKFIFFASLYFLLQELHKRLNAVKSGRDSSLRLGGCQVFVGSFFYVVKFMPWIPPLFESRLAQLLPEESMEQISPSFTEPLPKTIRRTKNAVLPPDWDLSPVADLPTAFFIQRPAGSPPLGHSWSHWGGEIYIASLSSLLSAEVLNPAPGSRVLDLCAAPGSKTTFLAEKMNHTGVLVANEVSSSRLAKLVANLERLNITNTLLWSMDGRRLPQHFGEDFDFILLDAPCSSEGFGRKRSDYFSTHWNLSTIYQCARLQKALLSAAFSMLRPGGTLLYSTCTTAPEENEAVVHSLLKKEPNAQMVPIDLPHIPHRRGVAQFSAENYPSEITDSVVRLYPHLRHERWNSECFFMAKITKTKSSSAPAHRSKKRTIPTLNRAKIETPWQEYFGWEESHFPSERSYFKTNNGIFLSTPQAAEWWEIYGGQRGSFLSQGKNEFVSSALARWLAPMASRNRIQFSAENSALRWRSGLNHAWEAPVDLSAGSPQLVSWDRYGLGYGKSYHDHLKNKLPRSWVVA